MTPGIIQARARVCVCVCDRCMYGIYAQHYCIYVCLCACTRGVCSVLMGEWSTFLPSSLFRVGFDTSKQ